MTGSCLRVARVRAVHMSKHQVSTEPRHDHGPGTDDLWAWIIIGLLAGSVALAAWLPMIAAFRA
jgi:hypothetical protein